MIVIDYSYFMCTWCNEVRVQVLPKLDSPPNVFGPGSRIAEGIFTTKFLCQMAGLKVQRCYKCVFSHCVS